MKKEKAATARFAAFSFACSYLPSASTNALAYGGRSGGRRAEIRCPSTTTGSSIQVAPAFSISSRIPGVDVTLRP